MNCAKNDYEECLLLLEHKFRVRYSTQDPLAQGSTTRAREELERTVYIQAQLPQLFIPRVDLLLNRLQDLRPIDLPERLAGTLVWG